MPAQNSTHQKGNMKEDSQIFGTTKQNVDTTATRHLGFCTPGTYPFYEKAYKCASMPLLAKIH